MYFDLFSNKNIKIDDRILQDITRSVKYKEISDKRFIFTTYYVQDGERPDTLSNKFYGVPFYHWIFLLVNDMKLSDWPKSDKSLLKYAKRKYGSFLYDVNHYVDENGNVVNYSFPTKFLVNGEEQTYGFNAGEGLGALKDDRLYIYGTPVTNLDYEISLNDKKKKIQVLDKDHVTNFINLTRELLNS